MSKLRSKRSCDLSDVSVINTFNKKKIVRGFTTNPSVMRTAGAKDYQKYSKKILKTCKNQPISFEVFGDDYNSMKDPAFKINSWSKNVYVKVPDVHAKGTCTGT